MLNDNDITDYGTHPYIYFQVKDKDWYDQLSSDVTQANVITGGANISNIFKLVATSSGGTGDVEDLYDSTRDSGGVTF